MTPEPPGPPHGPDDGTVTSLGPAISDPSLSSSASTPLFGSDRLVRGGLLLLVGNVLTKLSSVATTVVIVRQLSVTDFGRYSFAFAYGTFFALFADLGLNAIATRNLATAELDDGGRIVGSALAVKGAIVLTCLVGSTAGLLLFRPGLRLAGLVAAVSVANAKIFAKLRLAGRRLEAPGREERARAAIAVQHESTEHVHEAVTFLAERELAALLNRHSLWQPTPVSWPWSRCRRLGRSQRLWCWAASLAAGYPAACTSTARQWANWFATRRRWHCLVWPWSSSAEPISCFSPGSPAVGSSPAMRQPSALWRP